MNGISKFAICCILLLSTITTGLRADYASEKSKVTTRKSEAELNIGNLNTDISNARNALPAAQSLVEQLAPEVQSDKADLDAANNVLSAIAARIQSANSRIQIDAVQIQYDNGVMSNCDTKIANDSAECAIYESLREDLQAAADMYSWYAYMSDVSNFVYYEVMAEGSQMAADAEETEVERLLAEIDSYQTKEDNAFGDLMNAEGDSIQASADIQAAEAERPAAQAEYNRVNQIYTAASDKLFAAQQDVAKLNATIKGAQDIINDYQIDLQECTNWLSENPDEATWLQNGSPSGDLTPPE